MKNRVRLSQCMIVKNEEENIRKALSWGKGIVCEQIVVDTGSTDKTIEIAKEMGAVVYQFQWINDFSAAKNYAIEQASGDWIAFLDADEYFSKEDALKLKRILDKGIDQNIEAINCSLIHINDSGKPFATSGQTRIFRNKKGLRYHNKIHEQLQWTDGHTIGCIYLQDEFSILHTGYSDSSYRKTGKLERNIVMLQKVLAETPEDYNMWSYLGDSLLVENRCQEAAQAYEVVLTHADSGHLQDGRLNYAAYSYMQILMDKNDPDAGDKIRAIYSFMEKRGNMNPDIIFQMGKWMLRLSHWGEALGYFESAVRQLEQYNGIDVIYMLGNMELVYYVTAAAAQEYGDIRKAVSYCVKGLQIERYSDRILIPLLSMLKDDKESTADSVLQFLGKLYHINELKDKLYIYKCAKAVSYYELEDILYDSFSQQEKDWFNSGELNPYRPDKNMGSKIYPDIMIKNEIDMQFLTLMEEIRLCSYEEILNTIKGNLLHLKEKSLRDYQTFVTYFSSYHFWGKLLPEQHNYEVLEKRAAVLKEHREDFLWLYTRLEDYRSKKTLFAILDNWLHLNTNYLAQIKENGSDYFDLDILPSAQGEVFVDLGAYTGDTLLDYIHIYGEVYQHVYCYEITSESLEALKRNARKFRNVTIRPKAAGAEHKTMYLTKSIHNSANFLIEHGEGIGYEVITLDDDIKEKISLLKMDIEGAEQDAIRGAVNHIRNDHCKLAISTYHGYDDIWKIPRMIDGLSPDYHFYMRHYGGNLIPTEFVLFAV